MGRLKPTSLATRDSMRGTSRWMRPLRASENAILYVLMGMMAFVIVLAAIELAWILIQDALTPTRFLLEIDELIEILGQFLLVLVALELFHSVRAYLEHHEVQLDAVLTVALIAVARKLILTDLAAWSPATLLGLAAIVLALALARFLAWRHREAPRGATE